MNKEKKNQNRNVNIGLVLAIFGLLMISPIVRADICATEDTPICDAGRDYKRKMDAVEAQSQRSDMWYTINIGRDITAGSIGYLSQLTNGYTTSVDNAIESGKKFKIVLFENKENFDKKGLLLQIKSVERNEEIMRNNSIITVASYERIKSKYELDRDYEQKREREIVKQSAERIADLEKKRVDDSNYQEKVARERENFDKLNNMKSVPGFDIVLGMIGIGTIYMLRRRNRI